MCSRKARQQHPGGAYQGRHNGGGLAGPHDRMWSLSWRLGDDMDGGGWRGGGDTADADASDEPGMPMKCWPVLTRAALSLDAPT